VASNIFEQNIEYGQSNDTIEYIMAGPFAAVA
jgi:hypothetical protein